MFLNLGLAISILSQTLFPAGHFAAASTDELLIPDSPDSAYIISTDNDCLLAQANPYTQFKTPQRIKIVITAYTSSPEETDDTPHITAIGTPTRDGIVATNLLPIGTVIKIPSLFGHKKFVVEDRMHQRFQKRVDIWMESKEEAILFGKKYAEIEIL